MCKTPKWFSTYSNGVLCRVKNRNPIALILWYKKNPQDPFSFHILKSCDRESSNEAKRKKNDDDENEEFGSKEKQGGGGGGVRKMKFGAEEREV